jgi:hypothetical protein
VKVAHRFLDALLGDRDGLVPTLGAGRDFIAAADEVEVPGHDDANGHGHYKRYRESTAMFSIF